jgi:hypothetical protein
MLSKEVEEMRRQVNELTTCLQNHNCTLNGGLHGLNMVPQQTDLTSESINGLVPLYVFNNNIR